MLGGSPRGVQPPSEPGKTGRGTYHGPMTTQPPAPKFDPKAAHQCKPKLRAVRAFPANVQGQQAMGLADARQISDRMVVTSPAFQAVLPLMDGTRSVDEIVTQTGRGLTREILEPLVAQLDDAGLLFGPVFDRIQAKMKAEFDSAPTLPPAATAQFADSLLEQALGDGYKELNDMERSLRGAEKLREFFDQCIAQSLENADSPTLPGLPKVIIAPHLDYSRGWLNYGHAYGRLRNLEKPARIVILGTNHFGEGTGVVGCDKGYESPLGTCPVDEELVAMLRGSLGETLFKNRFDHEREHSIELHIPWIQHIFGMGADSPRVFAALIHEEGRAGIMVTHDFRMMRFVDRMIHMQDGQIDRILSDRHEIDALAYADAMTVAPAVVTAGAQPAAA